MKIQTSIIVAILMFFAINTQAQMRMSHEERVKQYKDTLKLSDKQTKTIDTILTKMESKMQEIRESGSFDRESFMKINEDSNKEIEKILNATQKEKFKKMIEERQKRMREMGAGRNQ